MTVCYPPGSVNGSGAKYYAGLCPSGWTSSKASADQTGGGSTSGVRSASGSPARPNLPPDNDRTVWYPKMPGTYDVSNIQPGGYGLQDFISNPSTSSFAPSQFQTKGYAGSQVGMLPFEDQAMLLGIARASGGRSMGPVWDMFVEQASAYGQAGKRVTPIELARQYAAQAGISAADGMGSSGGSGAPAPMAAGPDSIRRIMDSLSNDLLGRTLSDKEFQQYYGSYRSAFSGNPEVDMQQHGIEALQANDDYQEYQVASKFASAMDSVLRGAA